MSRRALNLVLLLALLGSIALNRLTREEPARRNYEFLPEMVRSAAYDAYSPNPVFDDGSTLRAPVPGTIPRGYLPLHYRGTPQDAVRAGEQLQNPFALVVPAAVQRGAAVYGAFCVACHGAAGNGDGTVVLRGYPAPPPLAAEKARAMKDGQIFHVLTYGQGNMPSYAAQLSREDRWKAILYIRSLQAQASTVPAPALARR